VNLKKKPVRHLITVETRIAFFVIIFNLIVEENNGITLSHMYNNFITLWVLPFLTEFIANNLERDKGGFPRACARLQDAFN